MNFTAVRAIYLFEMAPHLADAAAKHRLSPVVSTSLYFVVFGAAIGSRITSGRMASAMAPSSCRGW